MFRWGHAQVPGIIFYYAKELGLELEDFGILSSIFYTLEKTKPFSQMSVQVGQILQACPFLTKNKLSRRLARLQRMEIIAFEGSENISDRVVELEPLMIRLEALLEQEYYQNSAAQNLFFLDNEAQNPERHNKIDDLPYLAEEAQAADLNALNASKSYRKIADFIAKKTGNLMSIKMSNELKKWLDELKLAPEFLLCMLELCFERKIYNPKEITKIAKDLKECFISTLEGLESYFKNFVDNRKAINLVSNRFDPDIADFGNHTGIDMNAEARKQSYYKWRYDWGFSHLMIMRAGEIMCQYTRNGGLEYIDSVLHNWLVKEIRQLDEVEKEMEKYKNRAKNKTISDKKNNNETLKEYELFIPPLGNK
jgi:DNA replication protein DnaD